MAKYAESVTDFQEKVELSLFNATLWDKNIHVAGKKFHQ